MESDIKVAQSRFPVDPRLSFEKYVDGFPKFLLIQFQTQRASSRTATVAWRYDFAELRLDCAGPTTSPQSRKDTRVHTECTRAFPSRVSALCSWFSCTSQWSWLPCNWGCWPVHCAWVAVPSGRRLCLLCFLRFCICSLLGTMLVLCVFLLSFRWWKISRHFRNELATLQYS